MIPEMMQKVFITQWRNKHRVIYLLTIAHFFIGWHASKQLLFYRQLLKIFHELVALYVVVTV